MTMTEVTLKDSPPRTIGRGKLTDRDFLYVATERMAAILFERKLCLRVTLVHDTIVIGDAFFENDPVEFFFTSRRTFRRLFHRMRLINFATAYFNGSLVVRGPISKAVEILDAMNRATDRRETIAEFCGRLLIRGLKVVLPGYSKKFESLDHYSQSAEAYELFLDEHMQYTCAHFASGNEDMSLGEAQVAKFHLIESFARKHIGTLVGKDHLDVGCGWGGMGAFFQNTFGTRTLGNTNCKRQMEYARRQYGVEIFQGDFSKLTQCPRRFDLVTIVGMIEHLTPHRRSQLLHVVSGLLKPGGIVYLQCICKPKAWIGGDAYRVVKRQIFRGHFLETPEQTEARVRDCGFTILEKVDHSHDYALTTSRWVHNIQNKEAALVPRIIDPKGYRMYLGYLAYASKLFGEGRGCLMRYVLTKH